jgi:hypothetical protein
VVQIIMDADDPEGAAHTLLRIGAHSVRIASTDLSTELVERRFTRMADLIDRSVEAAVNRLADTTNHLLDEETGTFPKVVAEVTGELEQLLSDAFDEDSKSSVIAKIENVLTDNAVGLAKTVKSTFDLDEPASPLARTKREVVEVVKDEVGNVMHEVREIATAIATNTATERIASKLTSKGISFEDLVAVSLEQIAAVYGDIVERVGTTVGAAGTKQGDVRVTLCLDDTFGQEVRIVFECRDREVSMSKTLADLDGATANHQASAALAVFAEASLAPVALPLWYSGSRAIFTFDKGEPDLQMLQLAYAGGRWVARRSLVANGDDAADAAVIEAAFGRARLALTKHQTIKSCHSVIKKKADEAKLHVDALVDEVDQALTTLRDLLSPEG